MGLFFSLKGAYTFECNILMAIFEELSHIFAQLPHNTTSLVLKQLETALDTHNQFLTATI